MKKSDIFKTLKSLKISRMFVYQPIQLFTETGDLKDRQRSGRPRAVLTPHTVNAVKARIDRHSLCKQINLSCEMKISKNSMSRIIKEDLRLGAYKKHTGHLLTEDLKRKRWQKITNEKIFTHSLTHNLSISKMIGFMPDLLRKRLNLFQKFKGIIIEHQLRFGGESALMGLLVFIFVKNFG